MLALQDAYAKARTSTPVDAAAGGKGDTPAGAAAAPAMDAETRARVTALYESVCKWDAVAGAVPGVVERLKSLRTLHEHALAHLQTAQSLKAQQDATSQQIATSQALLKEMQTSLPANMQRIEANFAALDERLSKLSEQIKS